MKFPHRYTKLFLIIDTKDEKAANSVTNDILIRWPVKVATEYSGDRVTADIETERSAEEDIAAALEVIEENMEGITDANFFFMVKPFGRKGHDTKVTVNEGKEPRCQRPSNP